VEHYVIAWVATAPPYDVMVTELSAKHIHYGKRKVLRGISLLEECLSEGKFHGDFDDNTVVEPTGYYVHMHEQMDMRGELPTIKAGKENPKK